MTEITANIRKSKRRPPGPRYLIDPRAFILALVSAPLIIGFLFFWLLVPAVAVVMGGPFYLLTATPVMLWWLGRHQPNVLTAAILGFLSNLVVVGVIYLLHLAEVGRGYHDVANIYLVFGSIMAPIWAGFFALLYQSWRRDAFAQPIAA
ncbi:MAG: hypothetical protein AAF231_13940 [Pseudomonadota bacterium]